MLKQAFSIFGKVKKLLIAFLMIQFIGCTFLASHAEINDAYESIDGSKPSRIAVFPLFAEEILIDMVGAERLVFVGHSYFENGECYSPTMPLTRHIPGSNWQNCDEEYVLSLQPDLIILPSELEGIYRDEDHGIFQQSKKSQTLVLFVDMPQNISEIMDTIRLLGNVVGEPEKADEMIANMKKDLDAIEKLKKMSVNDYKKAVYYDVWQNQFSTLAEACGLINLYQDNPSYVTLDDEQIARWNPDIIFFNPVWLDTDGSVLSDSKIYADNVIQNILSNPALADTSAIKNKMVHPIHLHSSHYVTKSMKEIIQFTYLQSSVSSTD